jgi:hypothetical protein
MKSSICRLFFSSLCLISILPILAKAEDGISKNAIRIARDTHGQDNPSNNGKKYVFQSGRKAGQIDHVAVKLKVAGEIIDFVKDKENREKLNVTTNLDYDEKTIDAISSADQSSRSVRYYNKTDVEIVVGNNVFKPVLQPERSLIVNEITPKAAMLFSPNGPLSSDELDLIDIQGDSLLLDQFLPDHPVAVGDTWIHSETLIAEFLGLDEVGATDVQSSLKEVTDQVARFEMSGRVSGAINGITSEIELKAAYRFVLKNKRIDWLGMALKEKRQTSTVSDGLDIGAQLQVTIIPSETSGHLSNAELKDIPLRSSPKFLRLSHLSKQGGWELTHDRDWHIYRNQQDSAVLRRIESGDLTAQCNLSSLPQAKPDKLISLEEYQEDIKQALKKEFSEFVEAGQGMDGQNRRVLRVIVRGTASDLPIIWRYYHIADQDGRQMSCVFTIEEKFADRLQNADRNLIDSLRFVDSKK